MAILTQIVAWLNLAANAVGGILLAPLSFLPDWIAFLLLGTATGVVMLIAYKFTSNQRAIKKVRDDIKANMLALKLFKDNGPVILRAQGRLLRGAAMLLLLSIVPMLVMFIPLTLVLTQLSLWQQSRPLAVGEEAVLLIKLRGAGETSWPTVTLDPNQNIEILTGPVVIKSKREMVWKLAAKKPGRHRLIFHAEDQEIDKELVIGQERHRVSAMRPGWSWTDMVVHPGETPLEANSPIQAMEINYDRRWSWSFFGLEPWILYWFLAAMVSAFCLRKRLGVHL